MKPHRILKIKPCKKCGNTDIEIEFYFKKQLDGGYRSFLWESEGFVCRVKCEKCGYFPMQFKDKTEDAIYHWNTN
jgi:hypothetical protein